LISEEKNKYGTQALWPVSFMSFLFELHIHIMVIEVQGRISFFPVKIEQVTPETRT
jgi:hypothetical protein